jgi:hypothetical protein
MNFRDARRKLNEYQTIVLVLVAFTALVVGTPLAIHWTAKRIADRLFPDVPSGAADLPRSPEPAFDLESYGTASVGGAGQRRARAGQAARADARPGRPIENQPARLDR